MTQDLQLTRPIVTFDVETTGLDVTTDRIIEIACIKIHPDGRRETRTHRINPERPIGPQATAVHGIYDADVASCPTFTQLAGELLEFLRGCDLSGFNIERFDLPLLTREFARCDISFPSEPIHVVDSLRIFTLNEPRDLRAAFRYYCNGELHNAHSAEADASAAADVLLAQVRRYSDIPTNVEALHDYTHPKRPEWVDPDGKIIWRDNEAVLSFGKHRNRTLQQLAEAEPDYLRWIITSDFSQAVQSIAKAALDGQFPQPPAPAAAPMP